MNIDVATALVIVGGLVGLSVINELVKLFFQKMRTTDLVKVVDCNLMRTACSAAKTKEMETHMEEQEIEKEQEKEARQRLEKKVEAIAKLVLAMAIKMGIDVKDIQGLM